MSKLQNIKLCCITWDKRFREDLGNIEELADTIKNKGILQPITVRQVGDGTYEGMAGFRRFTAAGLAGLAEIPTLVRDDCVDDKDIDLREIELIENIYKKEFTWDERAKLTQEIDRLYKSKDHNWSGRKTAALLGKDVAEISRALKLANACEAIPEIAQCKTADEALKFVKKIEEQQIVSELRKRQDVGVGIKKSSLDMLRVANANYRIGDVFEGLKQLNAGGPIGFIECDPPYGIDLNKIKFGADAITSNAVTYKEIDSNAYTEFLNHLTAELFRVANKDCWMVFWYGPTWHTEVMASLRNAGWIVDDIPGIWVKPHGQTLQPELYLARCYEPFMICRKGNPIMMKRGQSNVFQNIAQNVGEKIHPTERPVALIEQLLGIFVNPTAVVLIPFLGSGNSLRACYSKNVKGFGWDLNAEYKDRFLLAVQDDLQSRGA